MLSYTVVLEVGVIPVATRSEDECRAKMLASYSIFLQQLHVGERLNLKVFFTAHDCCHPSGSSERSRC